MRIVCDIDECVVGYLESFCKYYNNDNNEKIKVEDFHEFDFFSVLARLSDDHGVQLMNNYLNSSYFDNMNFIKGAREGIELLADNHGLSFVTARPVNHTKKTKDYFEKHFPSRRFDVYFEPNGKIDRFECLNPDLIIEDSVASIEYADAGFGVLLLDKKWNRGVRHENIYRCGNWKEILDKIEDLKNV